MSTTSSGNDAPASPSSRLERFADSRLWASRPVTIVLTGFALVALYFVFTVPLAFSEQLMFATSCFVLALLFRRLESQYATLVMIMLSVVASGKLPAFCV